MSARGTLYLVGVGPGDPELLTLKAARLIGAVPVVAFPQTGRGGAGVQARALGIASAHIAATAIRMAVEIPMAVDRAGAEAAYDAAAGAIDAHLTAGRDVAFLCEGDPLFYGSANYFLARLAGPVVVVPGVTSLAAAAAAAGRPLAQQNDVLKVLPATLSDGVLRRELAGDCAAAIIKLGRHFSRVRALIDELGPRGDLLVVEASTPGATIVPLVAADDEQPYFSLILRPGRAP